MLRKNTAIKKACLLIIDEEPLSLAFTAYCTHLPIQINQLSSLSMLKTVGIPPSAVMIAWPQVASNPAIIHALFRLWAIPIFILLEEANEDLRILALELGADNVLTKPLQPAVLNQYIHASTKRIDGKANLLAQQTALFFNHWCLIPSTRQFMTINHHQQVLSADEHVLLTFFMHHAHRNISREDLCRVTKDGKNPLSRHIDIKIARLRQKIDGPLQQESVIKTVRNIGYVFTAPLICIKEGSIYF